MSPSVRLLSVFSLVLACSPSKPTQPAQPSSSWPMFRQDVERTGFAEGSVVGKRVERVWRIPSFNVTRYGAPKGSPSVVGDRLYCGTDTGLFLAARAEDGGVLWQARFGGTSHGIHGSPAVAGDFVYIGAYDGSMNAFDRAAGRLVWRRRIGYQVGSSPAVVPEWSMLFSSHEEADGTGDVVALGTSRGNVKWRRPTAGHPHSSVAVDVGRARVFVGDNAGTAYAFDAKSGNPTWKRVLETGPAEFEIKTTPTVIPPLNVVVLGAWSGKVYALAEDTGEIVWEQIVGGRLMGSNAYLPATHTLFVGSAAGGLVALDATNGRQRWRHESTAAVLSSPAVSGDGRAVVFGANDGSVTALATVDGRVIWSTRLDGQVSGSPTLVGNRIYVTSREGSLWALETR